MNFMPTAIATRDAPRSVRPKPMVLPRRTYLFSVAQYERMIEQHILTKNDRVELIRGEIVPKMPIGDSHASATMRLNRLLHQLIGDQSLIAVQSPVILQDSEPEPDISVVRLRDDFYASAKPRPKDVLLVIEVADSTMADDQTIKGSLYAENGIPEYWIVNLVEDCLEVYRSPTSTKYRKKQILHRGDFVEISTLKGVKFAVADLL